MRSSGNELCHHALSLLESIVRSLEAAWMLNTLLDSFMDSSIAATR